MVENGKGITYSTKLCQILKKQRNIHALPSQCTRTLYRTARELLTNTATSTYSLQHVETHQDSCWSPCDNRVNHYMEEQISTSQNAASGRRRQNVQPSSTTTSSNLSASLFAAVSSTTSVENELNQTFLKPKSEELQRLWELLYELQMKVFSSYNNYGQILSKWAAELMTSANSNHSCRTWCQYHNTVSQVATWKVANKTVHVCQ